MATWGTPAFGWKPDAFIENDVNTYDAEDIAIGGAPATSGTSSDLREWCSPIISQGGMMSCVPSAIVAGMELKRRINGKRWDGALSPAFLWWVARNIENSSTNNCGVGVRRALSLACTKGVCFEALHASTYANMFIKPSKTALSNGTLHKLAYCKRVKQLSGMKHALLHGHPFVFGIVVRTDFAYGDTVNTGIVHVPREGEEILGGHMMLAVGHDDATQMFIVKNSWGTGWGMDGYCMVPYDYVVNGWQSGDQWAITGGGYC